MLRALAVASAKRAARLPNCADARGSRRPGVEADAWFALFAPAKTPAATIERLYGAVSAGASTRRCVERHRRAGHDVGAPLARGTRRLAAGRSRQMGGGDQGRRRRRGVKGTGGRLNRSGIVL